MTLIASGRANSRKGRDGGSFLIGTGHAPAPPDIFLRRNGKRRMFRNVRILRHVTDDPPTADPRDQPVDQVPHILGLVRGRIETMLDRGDADGVQRRQADQVETEPGIERIGQCIELLGEQPLDHVRVA